jgi:hypothetical protein
MLCVSIHWWALNSVLPTKWIFVKFYVGDFCFNQFREFKCGENWTKIADTLFEEVHKIHISTAQKVLQHFPN